MQLRDLRKITFQILGISVDVALTQLGYITLGDRSDTHQLRIPLQISSIPEIDFSSGISGWQSQHARGLTESQL